MRQCESQPGSRRALGAGRAALAAAGFLIASVCSSQSPSQPAADPTFAQIVVLESLAAAAAAERRYPAAIDSHSRALQLAQTLQRPRLTAVLLTRLGQPMTVLELSPVVWQVLATAGFAGGFVYWLLAGRNA